MSSVNTSKKPHLWAKLRKISDEITSEQLGQLKYLFMDIIGEGKMEDCRHARDLFRLLCQSGKLDEDDVGILREALDLIGYQKLIKDHLQDMPYDTNTEHISDFRKRVFEIGAELDKGDLDELIFLWNNHLPAAVRESKCVWTVFSHMEKRGVISEDKLCGDESLEDALKGIDRYDLAERLTKTEKQPSMHLSATWPTTAAHTVTQSPSIINTTTTQDYKPAPDVSGIKHQPTKHYTIPPKILLAPSFFASLTPSRELHVPSSEMSALSLSPGLSRRQYGGQIPSAALGFPQQQGAHEYPPAMSGGDTYRQSPTRSVSMVSLRAPEDASFMFGHLHPGNQPQGRGDGAATICTQPEQSMQYIDNSMGFSMNPEVLRRHGDDTDTGRITHHQAAQGNLHVPPATTVTSFPTLSAGPQGGSTGQSTTGTATYTGSVNNNDTRAAETAAASEPALAASRAASTGATPESLSSSVPSKILHPQSASEGGSIVASNPMQETPAVVQEPSKQWTETKLGHRLKIFSYDQITSVAGQFREKISCEGGFGDVFKGRLVLECGITCEIAVKQMKGGPSIDQGEKQFKREESVADVRHPFIVPVIGVCAEPKKPLCIVYPYMEGGDLKRAIDIKDSRLTWRKSFGIILQISSALMYLHSHDIVHLDVKPGNILLDALFNARLGDVGLSKDIDSAKSRASLTGSHPGTPGYQDPSMLADWSISPTNDIYSLGVVMLRVLTRKPAFHKEEKKPYPVFLKKKGYLKDLDKLLQLADKDMWPSGDTPESSLTREFVELICRCLKEPDDRISAEELHEDMESLAKNARCEIYKEPSQPSDKSLCVICYSHPRVPHLSLMSKFCHNTCDNVCLQCLLDAPSNPLVCPKHGEAQPPIGHSNSFAIFVAAENFHRDATRLYKKFTNPNIGAIWKKNAILMTENSKDDDLKPTPENILHQLSVIEEKMDKKYEASLIFYFSGHGSAHGRKLMCNSRGLEVSALQQKLCRMNFTQMLIILDCCFAAERGPLPSVLLQDNAPSSDDGGASDLRGDDVAEDVAGEKFDDDHDIPVLYRLLETDAEVVEKVSPSKSPNYSRMQWSASQSEEKSIGYTDGTSLFTNHIIAGLRGAKKCQLRATRTTPNSECEECSHFRERVSKQCYITLNELIDYVHYHVSEQVARLGRPPQTPKIVAEEITRYRKIAYCKPEVE